MQIEIDAQRAANRTGRPMVIINLNRVGRPLLVIRGANVLEPGEKPYAGPFQPQAGE